MIEIEDAPMMESQKSNT